LLSAPERKPFRMAYRRDRQVNTKIRPEKMVGGQTQHFKDLLDSCFFKPGKFRIGKRQLWAASLRVV
jgi:hypothetical protein